MKKLGWIISFFSLSAMAAIAPSTKNALRQSAVLKGAGAIHGGLAGQGFSLLAVDTKLAKSHKLERLTVSMGNANFQSYAGAPGYFHIENSTDSKRVVINFMQAVNSKFDEKELQRKFASSPFVKSSQILFEPESQTLSLVLNMKKQAGVRVISVNGNKKQTAQLKIDLFDESLLNKKRR
jgi:hypothetical protein